MGNVIIFLIFFSVLAVVASLLLGIASMMKGGEESEERSNKLMIARVSFQALSLFLLALLWFVSQ